MGASTTKNHHGLTGLSHIRVSTGIHKPPGLPGWSSNQGHLILVVGQNHHPPNSDPREEFMKMPGSQGEAAAMRGRESQGIWGLVAAPLHHFGKVYISTEPRAITSVLLGPAWLEPGPVQGMKGGDGLEPHFSAGLPS